MANQFKRSEACCTRPPFDLPDLPLRGAFSNIAGIDTYITGSPTARHGIFVVYDIFGRFPQTLYGADILADGHDETNMDSPKYQVFIPDFYGSEASDYSWYPPDTEEKAKKLKEFFAGPADIDTINAKLKSNWSALAKMYPNFESWSIVGYCYGGEIAQFIMGDKLANWTEAMDSSKQGTNHPFKAAVLLHSGFSEDEKLVERLTVPILVLNSGEETQEEMQVFLEVTSAIGTKVEVEWFKDMVHGWMAARGELNKENVMKDFQKGYEMVRKFLITNL